MLDYFQYKQNLLNEYNTLINKYGPLNNSHSINCRLIYMDTETSVWDDVGGSLSYWNQKLNQLNWFVYENVPLFQNAPAVVQTNPHETTETSQTFTATIKFQIVPKPNDLLMFYDDQSNIVYKITDVRFHRNIENMLSIFECDFESAPLDPSNLYSELRVASHQYFNQFNYKLYDYETWMSTYQPIIDDIRNIIVQANQYFDNKFERYTIKEYNTLISDIKRCSKLGSVSQLKTPFTDCDDTCSDYDGTADTFGLYDKLQKLKEILC